MLGNEDTLLDVLVDLPAIRRMNLFDVDREEINAVLIRSVDPVQGPSLGPKRGSGIAPEDQGDRSIHEALRETNPLACCLPRRRKDGKFKVRSRLPNGRLRIGA